MRIRNVVGNVPEPAELYGRTILIEHLWRQIQANNILLLAPRRFGKTGIMRHVLGCPKSGYLPVYLDVEDVDSPVEFVWRAAREILSHHRLRSALHSARKVPQALVEWVKDTFDEVEFEGAKVKFKSELAADWQAAARRLLLEMEKVDGTVVFILDELPAMLEKLSKGPDGVGAAHAFVAWFRTVRMQQKDQLRRHRFIVGGSIGLDVILRRLDAVDKLNDFERIYVEPIQRGDAIRLVGDLAESLDVQLDGELVEYLLDLIGPSVPYFIHLMFSQLGQLPPDWRRPLTVAALDDVYRRRILGPTCKHYFDEYRSRLSRYGKTGEARAMALLRAVAESSQGHVPAGYLYEVYRKVRGRSPSQHDFDELMADLECDWYLVRDNATNEYGFMLGIMRDWWRRWYGTSQRALPPSEVS